MTARRTAVLMLSWEYPPIVEGGLARHVGKLAPRLVAGGIDVHVLTRTDGLAPAEEELGGVRVHRVHVADWPSDPDSFVAWVERMNAVLFRAGQALVQRFDFDIVHGHDWLVADAAEGLADRIERPLAMTIHSTEYGRHQGWIVADPPTRIHAAERRIVHRADLVIVCSEYMRGHLADVFDLDERRIAMISNGVDPLDYAAPSPEDALAVRERYAAPDQPLILFVGRLVYEKGFQIGLDALPQLIRHVPGLRYVVAGAGIYEAELKAQASRLGLDRHGSFIGRVDDDLLRALYRIADVCVVPSIYEPAGLVALEAMTAGCPCVVADTGGLRETVPHGEVGLRFAAREPGSLAAMVGLLLADRALRERVVAGGRRHLAGFDWATAAARTADVYRDLPGVPGRSRSASVAASRAAGHAKLSKVTRPPPAPRGRGAHPLDPIELAVIDRAYVGLEPVELWRHFSALNRIPRPSGSEERAARYVRDVAEGSGATWEADDAGNTVVRLAASTGREAAPVVVVQAHLDMVCESDTGVTYDGAADPIVPRRDGNDVLATGTTLGADDGLGVSAALALLSTPGISHGALELLFTVEEEIGLRGALAVDIWSEGR